jgi:hypothetical protein
VIRRHSRRVHGKPLRCEPSRDEQEKTHSVGKVVYPSVEVAQIAAAEIENAGYGAQTVYLCPRSRHGHAHLTQRAAVPAEGPRRPEDVPVAPREDVLCPRCGRLWYECSPNCRRDTRKRERDARLASD